MVNIRNGIPRALAYIYIYIYISHHTHILEVVENKLKIICTLVNIINGDNFLTTKVKYTLPKSNDNLVEKQVAHYDSELEMTHSIILLSVVL